MNRPRILERFDAEMRRDPPIARGELVERSPRLVLVRSPGACVLYARLAEPEAAALIAVELARAERETQEFEWKLFGHDPGPDLRPLLAAAAMRPTPAETLMVRERDAPLPASPIPPGIEIRRISTDEELDDAVRLSEDAFGSGDGWSSDGLRTRLADDDLAIFVARLVDGRTVSAGRLEMPAGRDFASLWGGATDPAYRDRGIYRALVAARAALAAERGFRYLTVDARATSRPILARLGFEPLTTMEGWVAPPPTAVRAASSSVRALVGPHHGLPE